MPVNPAYEHDARKVAGKWSVTEYDPALTFFGFPPLRQYRIRLAYGAQAVQRYADEPQWPELLFVDTYLRGRRVENVLSLCCGFGHVERAIVRRLATVRHCLGLDLAPGAVAEARRRAERDGLGDVMKYEVADLNLHAWPAGAYDLVIANGALHHLVNLEGVLSGIRQALRPDGILYANEYLGAPLQDHPPRQLELINAAAALVPAALRPRRPPPGGWLRRAVPRALWRAWDVARGRSHIPDPRDRPHWPASKKVAARVLRAALPLCRQPRPDFGPHYRGRRQHFLKTDPSEGVRSHQIIPLVGKYFAEVEVHPYGGGILAYALDASFYRRFDPLNRHHVDLLRLLCDVEEHYTDTGELGTEHAIIIATPHAHRRVGTATVEGAG